MRVKSGSDGRSYLLPQVLFLLGFFLLLVSRAYFVPLWGSSEAREAHVAELIAQTGEWILPSRNGLVPSKPPLLHWLSAILISVFSISGLFAARLVSALAAIGTTLLLANFFSCGGKNSSEKNQRWWLCAGIILTTYGFYALSFDARVDMLLCFLVTGATLAFYSGLQEVDCALPAAQRNQIKVMQCKVAVWCGLAVLAKGPLGVAFPALAAIAMVGSIFCNGKRSLLKTLCPHAAPIVIFALLALPWYFFASFYGGSAFIERQIIFENFARLVGGDGITSRPWHFYVPVLITTAFPWSLIAIFSLRSLAKNNKSAGFYLERISAVIWVAGVLFLSFSDGKRASYLLMLLPWLTLHVASVVTTHLSQEHRAIFWQRFLDRFLYFLSVFVLVAAGAFAVFTRYLVRAPLFNDLSTGIAITITCAVAWLVFLSIFRRLVTATQSNINIGFSLASLAGIAVCLASLGLVIKGELKDYEGAARSINKIVLKNDALFAVRERTDERLDPIFYTIRRPVSILSPRVQREQLPDSGYVIAPKKWLLERGFPVSEFFSEFLMQAPMKDSEFALVNLRP